ncbi:uncharacterized protein LOC127792920 [Diospyros lotus]|uniref:uncharacterized protein LOC127792920 n=1 Tax=Diospyros lotus TaxID=55363 RepID=UPI0022539FE8|nr:uncharacterized protein LOC127792920 [Diospyros lotus]
MAAEKIAVKELEVVKLKEVLRSCQVGDDKSESSGSLVVYHELRSEENGSYEVSSKREIEDFDMDEFLIKEGLCAVIFREAVKDAQSQISDLSTDYLQENDNRVSLELKVLEKTKELDLIKGELSDAVNQIEVDKVEIQNLKGHVGSQQAMLAKRSEENENRVSLELKVLEKNQGIGLDKG